MKRRKLPNHRAQAQAHHQRTDAYVGALIEDLRRQSLDSALLLAELVHYDGTEELYFDHVPQIRQAVQRIRLTYADRLRLGIASAVRREWNIASKGQDDFVAKALNAYGLQDEDGKYYPKNEDALQAFTKRREQGLKLSERVWDLSGEHMQSLERAISTAVHEGWSAATLSKRVSQYLKDFPKLKQDYTERFGKAIDVQDCEYKSARLARTEINMAYREAERTRWQELDFVTGYEVKRSGREYDCPVCSELAGKYPKDFKFAGWHPNCRCYAVPILSTEDEFWASFENDTPTPSSNEVTDVPENFKQWLSENAERHQRAKARGTEPYFLRDNPKYTDSKKSTAQQAKELKAKAKHLLHGKELRDGIRISNRGIKEWINQPHKHKAEKDKALLDIEKILSESKYIGAGIDKHRDSNIVHLYEVLINGDKSWLVVREFPNKIKLLHSISDNESITRIVKKLRR